MNRRHFRRPPNTKVNFLREVGELRHLHDVKQLTWTLRGFSLLSAAVEEEGKQQRIVSKSFFLGELELKFGIIPCITPSVREQQHVVLFVPERCGHILECDVSFKWGDGSVGTLEETVRRGFRRPGLGLAKFYRRAEVLRRMAPSEDLTLVFMLKRGFPLDVEPAECSCKPLIELEKLSEDFKDLLPDTDSCDATLVVRGKEVRVHKSVLAARSPAFAALFRRGAATVDIPDCDEGTFGTFLEYLYSGRAEFPDFSSAVELCRAATQYKVLELSSFCAEYLVKNLTVERLPDALALAAEQHHDAGELAFAVQDFFNEHYSRIVCSEGWRSLVRHDFGLANKLIVGFSSFVSTLQQQAVLTNETN